jgi:hypothetical protein
MAFGYIFPCFGMFGMFWYAESRKIWQPRMRMGQILPPMFARRKKSVFGNRRLGGQIQQRFGSRPSAEI